MYRQCCVSLAALLLVSSMISAQYIAHDPNPPDGAVGITSPLLQWTAGINAVMHEVYFGTNPAPGAAEFMGLVPGQTQSRQEVIVKG